MGKVKNRIKYEIKKSRKSKEKEIRGSRKKKEIKNVGNQKKLEKVRN